jgi:DNA polymerase V
MILVFDMQVFQVKQSKKKFLPLFSSRVAAGFPSPADDYVDSKLDLNEHLIRKPHSTFFATVEGDSMIDEGIIPGDIVVVDRSENPVDGSLVLAVIDSEYTLKRFRKIKNKMYLVPANKNYSTIEINEEMDFTIWGVVTGVVRNLRKS